MIQAILSRDSQKSNKKKRDNFMCHKVFNFKEDNEQTKTECNRIMLTITAFIVPLKLRTKGEVGYAAPSGS